jgi:peptidylprolyl isomerase
VNVDERPVVTVPGTAAPAELLVEDAVIGDGAEAVSGAQVSVDYVGVSWSTGKEFDASWNRGAPLTFTLGVGQVISGWDQGVAGMRVGGRRTITIPPHLGYGSAGAGGVIAPNETLVFTVDLRSIG